uniref:Solute carrier family 15 member 1 n=1 Tax=Gasterosteus aculeatus aculeatus TaxID=481459 RepID=A0AAQ4PS10_GASAC
MVINKVNDHNRATVCGFPISIFFIVVNEFCERFSYYGMRAVLVLYFKYFLRWDDDFATTIYHTFVALCYLTPIMGAIVADSWLGKFKTIVYLSIVYTVGQVVLAVSAIHDITDTNRDGTPDNMTLHIVLSMLGLALIAVGTGGIKPCVSAFGGDQFQDHQEKQRGTFFSIFYLSINAGSLLSTIITPILRGQECGIYTKQKCYSLAFGVPAGLMVASLIVFIVGSGMYIKTPPQGNIMVKFFTCIGFAIKNRFRHRTNEFPKRTHWMDWAEEKYDKLLIAQVKMVLKVLFLYIPLPMFWALYDQQGSRWTLQATNMDGDFGILTIQPDQMQTINAILILLLVPIVESVIYPLIAKCKINFTPLRRITVGMFFAALAFIAAALVEIQIEVSITTSVTTKTKNKHCRQQHVRLRRRTKGIVRLFFFMFMPQTAAQYQTGLCSHLCFSLHLRAQFKIKSAAEECVYTQELGFGSSFTLIIPPTFCEQSIRPVLDMEQNSFHMAWQIPQYFLLTLGEVVFSVTGLEFSYSQAPSNMKSVLQAGWLLTVAVGNIVVLIVAEAATLQDQWAEYVLFASLLLVVCVIFAIMAYFYTYIDPAKIEAEFAQIDPKQKEKRRNSRKDSVEQHKEERRSSDSSYDNEEQKQTRI